MRRCGSSNECVTDRQTDRPTDTASYRGALSHLKRQTGGTDKQTGFGIKRAHASEKLRDKTSITGREREIETERSRSVKNRLKRCQTLKEGKLKGEGLGQTAKEVICTSTERSVNWSELNGRFQLV